MTSTSIVRKVDELGRIVLPVELRRTLDIEIKDSLAIFVDGDRLILTKYQPACILCGEATDVVVYKGRKFCKRCLLDLALNYSTLETPSTSEIAEGLVQLAEETTQPMNEDTRV